MGFGEIIREFGVKVSLAFDSKKVDEAQNKIHKFGAELRSFAFEVAGLSAGVFAFQNNFTSNARSLQNQADLLGINTEKLQEYEYAAKVAADVNRDDLVGSLQTLGDTMDKARAGDLAARQALESIGGAGGNTAMILGRLNDPTYKVTDAFRDLSSGISQLSKNSPQAASRLTEMTLGNAKLYNLIRQGPKAIDQLTAEGAKNFALNAKMIKQGYLMDVQMSKLWMQFRKMGYEIGYSVMRHLGPMITQFTKWFQANKKVIASGINAFLDALADGLQAVWQVSLQVIQAMSPLVDKLGGVKNAVRLLIEGFIAFKAIQLGSSIAQMVLAFGQLGIAMGPIAIVVAGLASLGAIIHDLWTVLSGGKIEDTWLGQLGGYIDKVTGGKLNIGDKIYDYMFGNAEDQSIKDRMNAVDAMNKVKANGKAMNAMNTVRPSASVSLATAGGPSSGLMNQENHFNTTTTVMVPTGTTAPAAAAMISKANVDAHEQMMIKAKMDAARGRAY